MVIGAENRKPNLKILNLNKAIICGRVTKDPELRKTQSGASVTSFSIATNRNWTDKQGVKQEETEFHNIVAWARTAEVAAQYATKGSLLLVEGRLQTREWQDKDGNKRRSTEIVVERLQLGPKPMNATTPGAAPVINTAPASTTGDNIIEQKSPEVPTIDVGEDVAPPPEDDSIPF